MAGQKHFLRTPYGAYHNPPTFRREDRRAHPCRAGLGLRRVFAALLAARRHRVGGRRAAAEDPHVRRGSGAVQEPRRRLGAARPALQPSRHLAGVRRRREPKGLRCCYHSWLFAPDGRILETPGEPPSSTLKDRLYHGAYPVEEHDGLVFAYMGPPDKRPEFAPLRQRSPCRTTGWCPTTSPIPATGCRCRRT